MPYTDSLAHFYDLSTPVALPDLGIPGGNPGTGANIASNPVGVHGNSACAEFNGNNSNYNLGDVTMLNEVSAYTVAFWMRQDVLDVTDYIFAKVGGVNSRILIGIDAGGNMVFYPTFKGNHYGHFDYSTAVSIETWYHVAMVFDGAGAANADRAKIYVNANPITLTFTGTIEAQTPDLSGVDATIGNPTTAFDGLLDAFAIFTDPLTQLQVTDHMLATRQGRL